MSTKVEPLDLGGAGLPVSAHGPLRLGGLPAAPRVIPPRRPGGFWPSPRPAQEPGTTPDSGPPTPSPALAPSAQARARLPANSARKPPSCVSTGLENTLLREIGAVRASVGAGAEAERAAAGGRPSSANGGVAPAERFSWVSAVPEGARQTSANRIHGLITRPANQVSRAKRDQTGRCADEREPLERDGAEELGVYLQARRARPSAVSAGSGTTPVTEECGQD